jgi:hypothetical protein
VSKQLRSIQGIEISKLPFDLEWVGDLLFFNWPLISVYKDNSKKIYIRSWLEECNNTIRYVFFNIEPYLLLSYINGDTPFVDVLLNPANNLYFITDINSIEHYERTTVLSSSSIHPDYIPKIESYYDDEDSNDINSIISTFSLDALSIQDGTNLFDIVDEAKDSKSDLINIHLSSKNGVVGYGKIQSHILGEALTKYHKVAEATVLSLYGKNNNGSINKKQKTTLEEVKKLAITDYAYSKAASFSAFLKPIKIIKDNEGVTSIEKIQSTIFNLFKVGEELSELEKHPEFTQDMLTAFSSFLRVVTENDVNLTVQYGNPYKDYGYSEYFNKEKSHRIIENLLTPFLSSPVTKTYTGYYFAVNKRSRTFEFVSDDGVLFEGKFAEDLKLLIHTYRLDLKYAVTISTRTEIVKKRSVKKHAILSCVVVHD